MSQRDQRMLSKPEMTDTDTFFPTASISFYGTSIRQMMNRVRTLRRLR
jgi:hypothetical protein